MVLGNSRWRSQGISGRSMFDLLQRRRTVRPAAIPAGIRAYAIGDIHGRLDLVLALQDKIIEDMQRKPVGDPWIIYLGDYIDRGPSSREVLDLLTSSHPARCSVTHLLGNH